MTTSTPNLMKISDTIIQRLSYGDFPFFQDGGRLPSWILIQVKNGVTARCGQSVSTIKPNFVTVRQLAAELSRFAEKFKMAASGFCFSPIMTLRHVAGCQ